MPGMDKTMKEFKEHKLHSGSKKGPVVKSRKQAIAIGLSEARKAGGGAPYGGGKRISNGSYRKSHKTGGY